MAENGLTVFLSVPAIVTSRQRQIVSQWTGVLRHEGISTVRLERRDYSSAPWTQLNRLFAQVDGVVAFGLRQLTFTDAKWRSGTEEEATASGVWSSPWMHLEAGMAVALKLPILVVAEPEVTEGVFCPTVWSGLVFGLAGPVAEERILTDFVNAVSDRADRHPKAVTAMPHE